MTFARETNSRQSVTRSYRRSHRGGYVLVLVALILFGLMAMAALVIDIGLARLAQRQMQTAADTAALEALRGKGSVTTLMQLANWRQKTSLHGSLTTILMRRTATMDCELGGAFGAGPIVNFSDGSGDPNLYAGQLMSIDASNTVYKPIIQRGTEAPAEVRVSFQRGGTLDNNADLFAQGPPVPFLFARGSLINRQLIGDGITVLASSLTQPRPALKVGLPVAGGILPGAVAIGYELNDWNTTKSNPLVLDSPKTVIGEAVTIQGSATVLVNGYCSVFTKIIERDVVVGFGWIDHGSPLTQTNVAPGNAVSRLSEVWNDEVWNDIDPVIRDLVLARNAALINGLSVSTPKPLR